VEFQAHKSSPQMGIGCRVGSAPDF